MSGLTHKQATEKAKIYDSEFRFCPLYGGSCKNSCPANKLSEISLDKYSDGYKVEKGECTAYSLKGPKREL